MRDNLIIARAGDDSLHPNWLASGDERSFDLMVSYYGTEPDRFRAGAEHYHAVPGARWPAHHAICQELWDLLKRYEYIAFACDDLEATSSTWDRLFAICRAHQLDLAQAAIDGPVSHAITKPQLRCLYRLTNFVEIMCPIFHRPILEKLRWTMGESQSGWGLDYLWSSLLPYPQFKLAIVDGAPVRHMRPIGQGSLQRVLEDRGVMKRDEMNRLFSKHGINKFPLLEYLCVLPPAPTEATAVALDKSPT